MRAYCIIVMRWGEPG